MMREQTLVSCFATRFCFVKLTLGRMPIFTRRSRASTFSNNICTVVEEWHHGYFCLGYFFSSTHFDLVTLRAQNVWWLWVLVFAHDRYSHAENCIGLLSNTGLFLSTGNKYLFFLQRHTQTPVILDHCSCFDFLVSGVKVPLSKFLIYSTLHHCLQLLIIGHRYLLLNLHVIHFQYSF